MHYVLVKTLTVLVFLCLLIQPGSYLWWRTRQLDTNRQQLQDFRSQTIRPVGAKPNHWHFNWTSDAENYGLSSQQCDDSFPKIYAEIDRASAHWHGHAITPDTIDLYKDNDGGVRLLLHDGDIRVVETRGLQRKDFRIRINAVVNQLHRAVSAAKATSENFWDVEFTVAVGDWAKLKPNDHLALWSFTRDTYDHAHDDVWVIPDFNFWGSSTAAEAFNALQKDARQHDSLIIDKKPQIVWRGSLWTAPDIRGALLEVTKGKSWADVKEVFWRDHSDAAQANIMAMEDFCNYAFVCNTEGRSYSSRLTYILNCDSVPVTHVLRWVTHFSHLLDDYSNYIPVDRDFTDLPDKINHYLDDKLAAQDIADNARMTFRERYTTPAATACYWRRLLHAWAERAFKPEIYNADGSVRGISFDEFMARNHKTDIKPPSVKAG